MRILAYLLVIIVLAAKVALGEDKGSCPPLPPPSAFPTPKKPAPPLDSPERTYVGTVTLIAVVSDTGYVCGAKVIRGIDKRIDADAISTLRKWHYDPIRKNGRGVPVVITVDLNWWRDKQGQLVHTPSEPSTAH
jgi:TonB family protein